VRVANPAPRRSVPSSVGGRQGPVGDDSFLGAGAPLRPPASPTHGSEIRYVGETPNCRMMSSTEWGVIRR